MRRRRSQCVDVGEGEGGRAQARRGHMCAVVGCVGRGQGGGCGVEGEGEGAGEGVGEGRRAWAMEREGGRRWQRGRERG